MGVRRLRPEAFYARGMIDGVRCARTSGTHRETEDWEIASRARSVTGSLPGRLTVSEHSARWLQGDATAPRNTGVLHEANVAHINHAVASSAVARVTPSDITPMLNTNIGARSPAPAERFHRRASASSNASAAEVLDPSGSTVRSKRHRPRRRRSDHRMLERANSRSMLLQKQGWPQDATVRRLGLGARYREPARLAPHGIVLEGDLTRICRRYPAPGDTVRATKHHRYGTFVLPRTPEEITDVPRRPGHPRREIDVLVDMQQRATEGG